MHCWIAGEPSSQEYCTSNMKRTDPEVKPMDSSLYSDCMWMCVWLPGFGKVAMSPLSLAKHFKRGYGRQKAANIGLSLCCAKLSNRTSCFHILIVTISNRRLFIEHNTVPQSRCASSLKVSMPPFLSLLIWFLRVQGGYRMPFSIPVQRERFLSFVRVSRCLCTSCAVLIPGL